MGKIRVIGAVAALVGLVSCGGGDQATKPQPKHHTKGSLAELMDSATNLGNGVTVGGEGGRALSERELHRAVNWGNLVTLSEDADAMPSRELAELWSGRERESWDTDIDHARARAMARGRPLVLWFTNGKSSPTCKNLQREVWDNAEFAAWARKNVVRAKFDFNVTEGSMKERSRRKKELEALKKQYRAFGMPTLVILTADGKFVSRERGYSKGTQRWYIDQVKQRVGAAERSYAETVKRYEKLGYRMWHGKRGSQIFAKAVAYRDGKLALQKMDRKRLVVKEKDLSSVDRRWLADRKAEHEARRNR